MPPRGECPEQGSATGGHAAAGGDIDEVAAVEKPRSRGVGGGPKPQLAKPGPLVSRSIREDQGGCYTRPASLSRAPNFGGGVGLQPSDKTRLGPACFKCAGES
jgi:hypothetical protein